MGEEHWADTETAVRTALDTGDVAGLAPLLAAGVTWHGADPGGCHSRADVTAWLGGLPGGYRLRWLRRHADRIGFSVSDPAGGQAHELMTLDGAGRITAILDYPEAGAVEQDLVTPDGPAPDTSAAADALTPFVHVTDVDASAAFYARLGFDVVADHHSDQRRVWASLRCGAAGLMIALTDRPVDAAAQGVLFYLYTDDLAGLRRQLRAYGLLPSAIVDGSPGPSRELRIDDPDGYCLMIAERE